MSKLEKLDLIGVASLAAVTAALLVAWMGSTEPSMRVSTAASGSLVSRRAKLSTPR